MKKLVAAVLTGVLVAGTLSTGVYAKDDDKTITVAASATPHAEILEEAKPLLEKEGYDLEGTVFDDYVRPNEVVESGEFDANYFQIFRGQLPPMAQKRRAGAVSGGAAGRD